MSLADELGREPTGDEVVRDPLGRALTRRDFLQFMAVYTQALGAQTPADVAAAKDAARAMADRWRAEGTESRIVVEPPAPKALDLFGSHLPPADARSRHIVDRFKASRGIPRPGE